MRDLPLIAYEIQEADGLPITRAPSRRQWMDESDERFAYRCLPLVIANQCGWVIGSPASFSAWWNGGPLPTDTALDFGDDEPDARITGHFGLGVITFSLPYLFRTPQGINLWVKGPSNVIKDGVHALEGVVETDWSVATFTMNWKLTRPDHVVRFEQGEPICMIVPIDRDVAERSAPRRAAIEENETLAAEYETWALSRAAFNEGLDAGDGEALRTRWQKDYFRGRTPGGATAAGHRTKLALGEFD